MFRRKHLLARLLLLLLSVWAATDRAVAANKLIYAVFWTGCEELCEGFQEYLREENIDAEVVVRDAEQEKSRLPVFLEEARSMDADLILTYGTSVTLGIAGTLDDRDDPGFNNTIPHVFTVVADPVGSRVVESLEKTGRPNVTGTFNRVPESVNISTIRTVLPSFRRLGIVYNTNERNSVQKFEEIASLAGEMDFELVGARMDPGNDGLVRVAEIRPKVEELATAGVDFIYVGSSSFLDTNRDEFTAAAVDNGIPVLSPYERFVRDSHALLSVAARFRDVGRLAGEQAKKILVDGAVPGDLPVLPMTDFAYVVNMAVARKLDLFPSVEILQVAETVN